MAGRIIVPQRLADVLRFDPDQNKREMLAELNRLNPMTGAEFLRGIKATNYAGSEVLATLDVPGAAFNTSVAEGSLLPRSVVGPFAPSYWGNPRSCLRLTAYGTLSVVAATTPTILLKVKQNTAYANPIAGAILAGSVANVATATASGVANANWLIDVLMQVRATGQAGTVIATGRLHSTIFSATDTLRFITNANPPTAVAEDFTLMQYVDLTATWGTSAAGNTLQCLAYLLESLF